MTTINVRLKLNLFLAGPPIQAVLSQVGIKDSWAHQNYLRAHQNSDFYMYLNGTWAIAPFHGPIVTFG